MAYQRQYPTAPVTPASVGAARGGAVTTDGQAVAGVTQVINSIQGTKELAVTITNTSGVVKSNVVIFPGVQSDAANTALPENVSVTFSGFPSRDAALSYFAHISTMSIGLRLETSSTDNILGNNLVFSETEPDGFAVPTKVSIGRYKHDIGGGSYSKEVEIPAQQLTFNIWAALKMTIEKVAPNSTVTLFFPVNGWNKTQMMTPLRSAQL